MKSPLFGLFLAGLPLAGLAAPDAAAAGPGGDAGRRLALLIGVNIYDDVKAIERAGNLSYAGHDAERLAQVLWRGGFAPDGTVLMTTGFPRENPRHPTAANIRKQARAIAARIREGGSVVVSFSGYEMQFDGDDDFLCPADADAEDRHTLVTLRELAGVLGAAGRGDGGTKTLLIIDSCRGMEGTGAGKARTPRLDDRSAGVLFACSAGQFAFEVDDKRQGVLSYHIAEGLTGPADGDRDGSITVPELLAYVQKQVPMTRDNQNPGLLGPVPSVTFDLGR